MSLNPAAIIAIVVYTLLHACTWFWYQARVRQPDRLEAATGSAASRQAEASTGVMRVEHSAATCRRAASCINLPQKRQDMVERSILMIGVLILGCAVILSLAG